MPTAELSITPSEATQLFEEKVQRLRGEMGNAERASREALSQRDKALHEVTTLHQEKDRLVNELEKAKEDKQRILDSLAETRKNVEASLAKQEAKANEVIDKALVTETKVKEQDRAVKQLRGQVQGIKQSLLAEVVSIEKSVSDLVKKTREALAAIPD